MAACWKRVAISKWLVGNAERFPRFLRETSGEADGVSNGLAEGFHRTVSHGSFHSLFVRSVPRRHIAGGHDTEFLQGQASLV